MFLVRDRRLRFAAALLSAAVLLFGSARLVAGDAQAPGVRDAARPPKAALFRADGFPTVDGTIWHEPLPLELAREPEPLAALLGAALRAAGVETQPSETRIAARLLEAPKAVLAVCSNETPAAGQRRLKVERRAFDVPVGAGRARLVLFEKGTGRVIAATPGDPVKPSR